MEEPITPEELEAEIQKTFRDGSRRRVLRFIVLCIGLVLLLVIGVGFLSAEYSATSGGTRAAGAGTRR